MSLSVIVAGVRREGSLGAAFRAAAPSETATRPALTASFVFSAKNMAAFRRCREAGRSGPRMHFRSIGRDGSRSADLLHQVVVPLAFHLEVRGCSELHGFNQIMRHIGVDAGLLECVERSAGRPA